MARLALEPFFPHRVYHSIGDFGPDNKSDNLVEMIAIPMEEDMEEPEMRLLAHMMNQQPPFAEVRRVQTRWGSVWVAELTETDCDRLHDMLPPGRYSYSD